MFKKFSLRKNTLLIVCILIIFLQILQIVFFARSYYLNKYDSEYWKDRVEHSQWKLPLSKRIIGDDGLYSYVGYELVRGESPAFFNAEMPPVGKYLIGFSAHLFGSTAYFGLIFGIGSILVFFLLCRKILNSNTSALVCTSILLLDPIFFTQFWHSWLDISQLFFLLLNLLLLIIATQKRSVVALFLAGVSLGLFAGVKPPLLLGFIFLLEILYLYISKLRLNILIISAAIIIGYLMPYIYFFILGNSFNDFLSLQKYMVTFYLNSDLITNFGAVWPAIFIGKIPDLTSGIFENVSEWWFVWPMMLIAGVISGFKVLKERKEKLLLGLAIFVLGSLAIYSLIPLYVRYLILVLPFLYLLSFKMFQAHIHKLFSVIVISLILIFGIFNTALILEKDSRSPIQTFIYSFENQFFKDIYFENLSSSSQNNIDIEEFYAQAKKPMNDANIVDISFSNISLKTPYFSDTGELRAVVNYKTRYLGDFSESKKFLLVKEDGVWKINWDWDHLLADYKPGYRIVSEIIPGRRGDIIGKDLTLAKDTIGFLISVNPSLIDKDREEDMLDLLSEIGGQSRVGIHNTYTENIIPNTYIPLITNHITLTSEDVARLRSYKGVLLTEHPTREYFGGYNFNNIQNTFFEECCTRIYTSFSYNGVDGIEADYNSVLSGADGGSIKILDGSGKVVRTVIEKEPINGKDIVVDY